MPAATLVELTQVRKESVGRGIEVCCLLRDPLPKKLELSVHERVDSR
jgi:hypothetical protein